jgi:glycine hydroxymethyltransferase
VYNILEKVRASFPSRHCASAHPLQEKKRQQHFINLIPSENFTSQAVLDALGSVMQSVYPPTLCIASVY